MDKIVDLSDVSILKQYMTGDFYGSQRCLIGNQADVAKALGITRVTLSRRECDLTPIKREHVYALEALRLSKGARSHFAVLASLASSKAESDAARARMSPDVRAMVDKLGLDN